MLSVGVIVVGLVTLVGVWLGGTLGIDAVADATDPAHDLVRQAAGTIYQVSKRELVRQGWVLVALGAMATVAIAAITMAISLGRSRRAVPASADGPAG